MNKAMERFLLKHRYYCEMPDENGNPMHMHHATRIVQVKRNGYRYSIAACAACAGYLQRQNKNYAKGR